MAEENKHIFNNLTQVEKIKPKIDNPIIVEDVTYNFSDFIENEWISHFPQYSHRMRSTFVKGAEIVDEHIANINQYLIQLEDELYRVYDKLSDDKKAEVTKFIQARQNEVNTFIQARKDEVATFISDRKTEVADFIKDRKNEVSTFISDKQNLVDEFVKARKNEVADFIKSKTNEVSDYISQKENQITRFITTKDSEIKKRTDTLDSYTKDLEGKIDQFNRVLQGGEATDTKLGLITLNKIREVSPKVVIEVATYDDLKNNLTDKDGEGISVPYGDEELRIESFVKNLTDEQRANCIRSPKKRLIALNSDAFVENCLWSDKLINIAMNNKTIRDDVLNSPKALKKLFSIFTYINECLKLNNVNGFYEMFKNPKILDVTLMSSDTMKELGNQEILYILKLFTENESVRNNTTYVKELQKYKDKVLKSLLYSNGDWQAKKLHFYKEDYPEKLNGALGYNMIGLATLGAYSEGTDKECIITTEKDVEIARGNVQKLNEFDEKQTLKNITAIAFEGYKFKENHDGYITMVAFQLIKKGV